VLVDFSERFKRLLLQWMGIMSMSTCRRFTRIKRINKQTP